MSDLVELLNFHADQVEEVEYRRAAECMREAATALTAKDKEIEALREQKESLDREAATYCKWWQEQQARAETAERERDEARAALKLGLDLISDEKGWGTYPRIEGSEIYTEAEVFKDAARAVIKQGE